MKTDLTPPTFVLIFVIYFTNLLSQITALIVGSLISNKWKLFDRMGLWHNRVNMAAFFWTE
jgi:hypothetical protein